MNKTKPIGARAAFLATRPKEQAVQAATIKTICALIGGYRVETKKWAPSTIRLANAAREIGLFVIEFLDALPGKQLTPDFWHQFAGQFVDQHGQAISREQLLIFVKMARNNPDQFTLLQPAMSYRKPMLEAAGFELVGERPPGHANPVNFYNEFFAVLSPKKMAGVLKALEKDPHYGPLENWPDERKQRAWLQVETFYRLLAKIVAALRPST